MNDDWRLQIDVHDAKRADAFTKRLDAGELKHNLKTAFCDRVIVTRDGARVFVYTDTRSQVDRAREAAEVEACRQDWLLEIHCCRWHPIAEEWQDADKPMPTTAAAELAEQEALRARERQQAAESEQPEFEVRVDLPSRHDAVRFSKSLKEEGMTVVRRWKYLLIGVLDEDQGRLIARRLLAEAPTGTRVAVEGTWAKASGEKILNPFAFVGGLLG